jgi:CRP-like cAMP-binding protein
MVKRDQFMKHLAEVPMFSACTKKELGEVSRHAETLAFNAGQTLVREGDKADEFFVLVAGKAKVVRGGREIAVLGAGDWFGELALLDKAPRNATITAVTPVEVLVLSQRAFRGLLAEVPTISWRLMTGMARRLHELDAKV